MVYKKDHKQKFIIKRPEKWGGDIIYSNYEEIEKDYLSKQLHPQDLKNALAEEIIKLLDPVKKSFDLKQKLIKRAYPD